MASRTVDVHLVQSVPTSHRRVWSHRQSGRYAAAARRCPNHQLATRRNHRGDAFVVAACGRDIRQLPSHRRAVRPANRRAAADQGGRLNEISK